MSIGTQAGIALAFLALSWLLGRWASRYDVNSWISDALRRGIWGLLRRGDGRRPGDFSIDSVVESDPILKKQVSDKVSQVKADTARLGTARTAAKHGGLYALAYAVNLLAGPIMLVALILLAHAAWRWLS